jgi:hypothetical protein
MKHVNPYRINDPDNIFEVGENSSHPELRDAKRIWRFGAYTFHSATEIQRFFADEGLDPRRYDIEPVAKRMFHNNMIEINVVPKHQSRNERALRGLTA